MSRPVAAQPVRKRDLHRQNLQQMPPSYTSNTRREDTLLQYFEDFRRQFVRTNPNRKPLLLTALNEAGVSKPVCTSIRPTQLPFTRSLHSDTVMPEHIRVTPGAYDLRECAEFVSDFLDYIPPQEPAVELPTLLPSSASVIQMRAGDALDFAVLLESLLRGAGYDSYVVSGYAPRWITEVDQSETQCPLLADPSTLVDETVEAPGEMRAHPRSAKRVPVRPSTAPEPQSPAAHRSSEMFASPRSPGTMRSRGLDEDAPLPPGSPTNEAATPTATAASDAQASGAADFANTADDAKPQEQDASSGATVETPFSPSAGLGATALIAEIPAVNRSKYALRTRPELKSRYLEMLAAETKQQEEDNLRKLTQKRAFRLDRKMEPLHGRRVHFWVLVKKGTRDVRQDVFVEPTTGQIYSVAHAPYLGVESVWNEKNYWVNMQALKHDPTKDDPNNVPRFRNLQFSYDLKDRLRWEYALIGELRQTGDDAAWNKGDNFEEDDQTSTAAGVNKRQELAQAAEDADDGRPKLDTPMPGWTAPIVIARDVFRRRYPHGFKSIRYDKTVLEKFSEFAKSDLPGAVGGLVYRVTTYDTQDLITPVTIRDYYLHRQNRLAQCINDVSKGIVHYKFEPASEAIPDARTSKGLQQISGERLHAKRQKRPSGLTDLIEYSDFTPGVKRRVLKFAPYSRIDGLVEREETVGVKIVENFLGRDDLLHCREMYANLSTPTVRRDADSPDALLVDGRLVDPANLPLMLPFGRSDNVYITVQRIVEHYHRNNAKPVETDVRTITHQLSEGVVRLNYHYLPNSITASERWVPLLLTPASTTPGVDGPSLGMLGSRGAGKPSQSNPATSRTELSTGADGEDDLRAKAYKALRSAFPPPPLVQLDGPHTGFVLAAYTSGSSALPSATRKFETLEAAQIWLSSYQGECGGISYIDGVYEPRKGRVLLPSKTADKSWLKACEAPLQKSQDKEELLALRAKEKALREKVVRRDEYITQLLNELSTDRKLGAIERSLYDRAAELAEVHKQQENRKEEDNWLVYRIDYLSPFLEAELLSQGNKRELSPATLDRVKKAAMNWLRDRILERDAVLTSHLEQEESQLAENQQHFRRVAGTQGVNNTVEDEKFAETYAAANFRIDILKARCDELTNKSLRQVAVIADKIDRDLEQYRQDWALHGKAAIDNVYARNGLPRSRLP